MTADELTPSAILPPGRHAFSPAATPLSPPAAAAEPAPAASGASPPAPLVDTVGKIPGLRPRRARGDGGEVAGELVDRIDALGGTAWRTAAAWLADARAITTRQTRLADLAAFVRWLHAAVPGADLLQANEDQLVAYRDALGTGTATAGVRTPGKPLGPATVARRLAHLRSFFRYARRRGAVPVNPAENVTSPAVSTDGSTPALTRAEQTALAAGAQAMAERYPVGAAAVLLLIGSALRVGEAQALTVGSVIRDGERIAIRVRRKGGRHADLPMPPRAWPLIIPLRAGRAPGEALFTKDDGRPIDRWWTAAMLRRAARAGGLPDDVADRLHAHMMRATAITLLLEHEVAPLDKVQQLAGHRSSATTMRYKRRTGSLAAAVDGLDALLDPEEP
ncbi:hypothetical protein Ppa06_38790 [Planomonospora parontospora subsp. parontospora]|uniref:Integrase n=2 Tax=Planomonospora parontospora TaxID=58119 RepID=A0AA37F5P3_9ACTN|nr:tyrosine-type recombinase/integrase [Planomonospora parontospora]GGK76816.1 hypothetical protein GCM10010126_40120 [Planomonospora parontospora]GII10081.1 hypothetical protein Ppa06_38790 [Planomonospora parontospora subsp. parontospora]